METLAEKEWSEKDNRELLDLAELEEYDILVTTDQSIRYQQNLKSRRISIVVLMSANWMQIRRNVRKIALAIDTATPGEAVEVCIG